MILIVAISITALQLTVGYIAESGDYGYFILSDRLDGNINQNQANDLTVTLDATLQNRNFAYLTQASYLASGIANGTTVTQSGGSVTFPANTTVNSIAQRSFAGTNILRNKHSIMHSQVHYSQAQVL